MPGKKDGEEDNKSRRKILSGKYELFVVVAVVVVENYTSSLQENNNCRPTAV